jgi:hypothetical protein
MRKKTLVVNLFSSPGTGKSMMMHGILFELKMRGIDCEMSPEYAKELVWKRAYNALSNQMGVAGEQLQRLMDLDGKVDVIVTDHPYLFSLYYGQHEPKQFNGLIVEHFNAFNNLNFFLERKEGKYNDNGRLQTEEESLMINDVLKKIVDEHCDNCTYIETGRESVIHIADMIEEKLNNR